MRNRLTRLLTTRTSAPMPIQSLQHPTTTPMTTPTTSPSSTQSIFVLQCPLCSHPFSTPSNFPIHLQFNLPAISRTPRSGTKNGPLCKNNSTTRITTRQQNPPTQADSSTNPVTFKLPLQQEKRKRHPDTQQQPQKFPKPMNKRPIFQIFPTKALLPQCPPVPSFPNPIPPMFRTK